MVRLWLERNGIRNWHHRQFTNWLVLSILQVCCYVCYYLVIGIVERKHEETAPRIQTIVEERDPDYVTVERISKDDTDSTSSSDNDENDSYNVNNELKNMDLSATMARSPVNRRTLRRSIDKVIGVQVGVLMDWLCYWVVEEEEKQE